MEKQVAINILEDVIQSLIGDNAKCKGLSTVNQYIKGLEISTNEKIQTLINKQTEYRQHYGENHKRTLKLNKKIDEELRKIYNG